MMLRSLLFAGLIYSVTAFLLPINLGKGVTCQRPSSITTCNNANQQDDSQSYRHPFSQKAAAQVRGGGGGHYWSDLVICSSSSRVQVADELVMTSPMCNHDMFLSNT